MISPCPPMVPRGLDESARTSSGEVAFGPSRDLNYASPLPRLRSPPLRGPRNQEQNPVPRPPLRLSVRPRATSNRACPANSHISCEVLTRRCLSWDSICTRFVGQFEGSDERGFELGRSYLGKKGQGEKGGKNRGEPGPVGIREPRTLRRWTSDHSRRRRFHAELTCVQHRALVFRSVRELRKERDHGDAHRGPERAAEAGCLGYRGVVRAVDQATITRAAGVVRARGQYRAVRSTAAVDHALEAAGHGEGGIRQDSRV